MPTFHSLPFQRHFRAPLLSQASLCTVVFAALAIIMPFILAYVSQCKWSLFLSLCRDSERFSILLQLTLALIKRIHHSALWIKENSFREQPAVYYMKDLMLFMEGSTKSTGDPISIFYSTNPDINYLFEDEVRGVPTIRVCFCVFSDSMF
jgi:hypothetical protein